MDSPQPARRPAGAQPVPGPPAKRVDARAGEAAASTWGRVDPDGTVYVRTAEGERAVGQYPEGSPEEALSFFTRRFDALEFEVQLLEQRVRSGALSPDEATESIKKVAAQLVEPNAVGDIVGLSARLDALGPLIGVQRSKRREDRARRTEESHTRKKEIVAEAEKISQGKDWRNGVNRLRDLLEEWKALPRLDKKLDDELWHRFSGARTAYTRRRKTHFAELGEKREGARLVKQRLLKEAESLSTSREWGPTSSRYRELMQEWKAAGPAPRDIEEELWQRFRAAQDTFFGARDAANAEQDKEFAANAEKKKELLVEAEALLPVKDLDAAKRASGASASAGTPRARCPATRSSRWRPGSRRWSGRSARSRTTSGSAATRRSRRAPTTCSVSSSARSPASRPTSRRPAPQETSGRSRSSRRTSPRASSSSRWPARPLSDFS